MPSTPQHPLFRPPTSIPAATPPFPPSPHPALPVPLLLKLPGRKGQPCPMSHRPQRPLQTFLSPPHPGQLPASTGSGGAIPGSSAQDRHPACAHIPSPSKMAHLWLPGLGIAHPPTCTQSLGCHIHLWPAASHQAQLRPEPLPRPRVGLLGNRQGGAPPPATSLPVRLPQPEADPSKPRHSEAGGPPMRGGGSPRAWAWASDSRPKRTQTRPHDARRGTAVTDEVQL